MKQLFIFLAAVAAFPCASILRAQTVTGDSADHLGGNNLGTIAFQSSNSNANFASLPPWIQNNGRSVITVSGGENPIYEITLKFGYGQNVQADAVTETRSGSILTTVGHTVPVTQTGIDNTYVYDPPKGDWPSLLSHDPNSSSDAYYTIRVYSRVRYSDFRVDSQNPSPGSPYIDEAAEQHSVAHERAASKFLPPRLR